MKIFNPRTTIMNKTLLFSLFFVMMDLVFVCSCGEEEEIPISDSCYEPAPVSGDPRFGSAGQIMIDDRNLGTRGDGELDCLWIGINDSAVWEDIISGANGCRSLIGGIIIIDPNLPHGFYIAPATIFCTYGGIPELTTTIDWVEADPEKFSSGCFGGDGICQFWANIRKMVPNQ